MHSLCSVSSDSTINLNWGKKKSSEDTVTIQDGRQTFFKNLSIAIILTFHAGLAKCTEQVVNVCVTMMSSTAKQCVSVGFTAGVVVWLTPMCLIPLGFSVWFQFSLLLGEWVVWATNYVKKIYSHVVVCCHASFGIYFLPVTYSVPWKEIAIDTGIVFPVVCEVAGYISYIWAAELQWPI